MYKLNSINIICVFLFCLVVVFPPTSWAEIIFEDNFDNSPDWQSNQTVNKSQSGGYDITFDKTYEKYCTTFCPPDGWTSYRTSSSQFTDDPGNDTYILDSTGARGGSGKGITYWIESTDSYGTWSGGSLDKWLGKTGYKELYIRYYLKYSLEWKWSTPERNEHGQQKLIRISSFPDIDASGANPHFYGSSGDNMPVWYPDWYYNSSFPPAMFFSSVRKSPDYDSTSQTFSDVNWPDDSNWHSYEFYVKMNSTPGAADGIWRLYIDGELKKERDDIVWRKVGTSTDRGWNWLMFIDNVTVSPYALSDKKEMAIYMDDVVVSTSYIGPESVPVGGYDEANVIPAGQVSQATDGSGKVTINFKVLDEYDNMAITVSTFEYSTDDGGTWEAPTNGDSSAAFSSSWADNSYLSGQYSVINGTSAEWSGATAYSFTLNTKHADVTPLNQYEGNVKFRFYVNNGNPTSSNDPVQTESFSLDNMPPAPPG